MQEGAPSLCLPPSNGGEIGEPRIANRTPKRLCRHLPNALDYPGSRSHSREGRPLRNLSFGRKPKARPLVNKRGTLQNWAFHPHPNPLPRTGEGVTLRSPKAGSYSPRRVAAVPELDSRLRGNDGKCQHYLIHLASEDGYTCSSL